MKKILSFILAVVIAVSAVPFTGAAAAEKKLVAFTFDDGPSKYTSTLLDGLKARGAHATFFMAGTNGIHGLDQYPGVLSRMWKEGHQLANHTNSHIVPYEKQTPEVMSSEAEKVEKILFEAVGGEYTDCVRIPGGARSEGISENVKAPLIVWSVDTWDWRDRDADCVYNAILDNVKDGSIVLMHDIYETSVDGALMAMDELLMQGYEFVTVAELMRRRGVALEDGVNYYCASNNGYTLPAYSAPTLTYNYDITGATITASCQEEGLTFHYTLDGSYPNLGSPVIDGSTPVFKDGVYTVIGIDRYGTRTPVSTISAKSHPVSAGGKLFCDINTTAWYFDSVCWAVRNGYINEIGEYEFAPNRNISKAGIISALWNMAGRPEPSGECQFTDVPKTSWFYRQAAWAGEAGIVTGDTFSGGSKVTLESMSIYMCRYSRYVGRPLSGNTAVLTHFRDDYNISNYARWDMSKCISSGIISGTGNGYLYPKSFVTRARAAALLMKLSEARYS